jgi:hypothetical protein
MVEKKRKYYTAPQINAVALDNEICLIMMTQPPPNPTSAAPMDNPSPFEGPSPSAPPSAGSTPFGGDTPDYSNM